LCTLFNKSLSQGALPEEWKIANIVPTYKKGEKEYAENYLTPFNLTPFNFVESFGTLPFQGAAVPSN
jgi:hypothetical protein